MKSVNSFIKSSKLTVVIIVVLTIVANSLSSIYSVVYRNIIDLIIAYDATYFKYVLILLAITIINTFITFMSYHYLLKKLKIEVSNNVKILTLKSILSNSVTFFRKNSTGKLITAIVDETDVISEYSSLYYFIYISNTFRMIFTYTVMWFMSKELTIITVLTIPIYVYLSTRTHKNYDKVIKEERESKEAFIHDISTIVQTAPEIKNGCLDKYYMNQVDKSKIDFEDSSKKLIKKQGIITSLRDLMYSIMPTIILVIGSIFAFKGYLTVGTAIAFVGLIDGAYIPISEILYFRTLRIKYLEYYERFKILTTEDVVLKADSNKVIKCSDVEKRFNDERTISLNDLEIKANGIYSIRGENGVGKSTLLNILFGSDFFDNGTVSTPNDIAYMSQNKIIFKDKISNLISVEDNIKISYYLELLNIQISIEENIDSRKLSGGELKKVMLLLTLVKDRSIIFLDEPFNELDKDTIQNLKEYLINNADTKIFLIVDHTTELNDVEHNIIKM